MALPSITTRIDKGEPLTFTEMDGNLENLRDATISVTGDSGTSQDVNLNDTITVAGGTGVSTVASATNTVTVNLDNTAVTAGSYTAATITVDAQGRITAASSATIPTAVSELSNDSGFITGYTETDPVVGAISGIVKADGAGNISAAGPGIDYVASETVTSLSLATNTLSYVDENGTTTDIDLSLYLDDTNLARLTSGTLNASTGIATFTRDDASTFTVDFSALLNITFADLSVTENSASGGGSLAYSNINGVFTYTPPDLSSYLTSYTTELSEDLTPVLGGALDGAGNTVSDIELKNYKEDVYALTYGATLTPDVANGNVQTVTLTGNVTINGFSNAEAGQSMTIILTQDATGSRTLTTTMKMAGGDATLSTDANAIDILGIFYDGTNYYGSLSTAFATPA